MRAHSSDRPLEEALLALKAALDSSGAPWMIIGGIAIIARGVRRMTTDIDATVRGDAISPTALLQKFEPHDITPRIPDAAAFAEQNLVLLLRHVPSGVDLDISMAWSGFEHGALENRQDAAFGTVIAPMAVAADLMVYKAIAGRAKDQEDLDALLTLYPVDHQHLRRQIVELAELAELPELVLAFDAAWSRTVGAAR